jgi:hypothetical protein
VVLDGDQNGVSKATAYLNVVGEGFIPSLLTSVPIGAGSVDGVDSIVENGGRPRAMQPAVLRLVEQTRCIA